MPQKKGDDEGKFGDDFLSPEDMRQWAHQETIDARKALELRLREIDSIVKPYSAGEINPEKANEMYARYRHRWGEALPGATVGDGVPDDQILARIDKARGAFTTPRENHEAYRRLFGKDPGSGGQSR
jgi:hypothetical protein